MALRAGDVLRQTAQRILDPDGYEVVKAEKPRNWSQTHAPAAATQATTSKAAGGAAARHVCTGFIVTISNTAASAGTVTFVLRDGATGAGTILASFTIAIPATANTSKEVVVNDAAIEGSLNTAMTLESTAAPAAGVSAAVTLTGYTV